jgi:hypothetical protein
MEGLKEWFEKLKTKNGYRVLAKKDRAVITKLVSEELNKESAKPSGNMVIKTSGPESPNGRLRGHCYDGTGWRECDFWEHNEDGSESVCTLFGPGGVDKKGSEALRVCDKIYGIEYNGEV